MEAEHAHEEQYRVVVNDEEQYSIWPFRREVPAGWRDAGKSGVKSECLAWIQEVWTDMRPMSVRRQQDSAAAKGVSAPAEDLQRGAKTDD